MLYKRVHLSNHTSLRVFHTCQVSHFTPEAHIFSAGISWLSHYKSDKALMHSGRYFLQASVSVRRGGDHVGSEGSDSHVYCLLWLKSGTVTFQVL